VRIHVETTEAPARLVVASRVAGRWTIHAEGRVREADQTPSGHVPAAPAGAAEYTDERPFETQPGRLKLGPRWNALRRLDVADGVALGELALEGRFENDTQGFGLHPALLDLATGVALSLVSDREGLWVPMGYDRVVAATALSSRARVRAVQAGEASHETVRFDVEMTDGDGNVVAHIQGLTMRRIDESALAVGRAADGLSEGISNEEGVDALARLLASAHGGVVTVSPLPLEALAAPRQAPPRSALPDHAGDGAASKGPRDEIESFLAGQWSELLGATSVGLDDDFFDLGGHSLLALRLFARLEKRFGKSLPLATLFEAPTVAQLAEHVRGGPIVSADAGAAPVAAANRRDTAFSHLVRIRPGGAAVPFFCVHGAGGNVLNFRDLARAMRDERAFYGLQARGVDGLAEPHDTIEAMAQAYLAEVTSVQPEGPYLLGGYSGGGVIAFEMARQLGEAGHDVASVVFLDTFLPGAAAPDEQGIGARAGGRLQGLIAEGPGYVAKWMRQRWAFESWRLREWRLSLPRPAGQALPASLREVKLTRAFHHAANQYRLRPLNVPIVLFTAAERGPGTEHVGSDLGWSPYATGGMDIRLSPGTHDDLVREPNVGVLADALAGVLRAATARTMASAAS
jgi:thioesterase domain-containing protein/acyl carrier protein